MNRPIHPLNGRFVRPRPIVAVMLFGPHGPLPADAILDTAADDTVFPDQFAPLIGVDLNSAPVGEATGATGQPIAVRYAPVELRLFDGVEVRRWPAIVAFGSIARPLLGFAGCLQFFTATFKGDLEEVELAVNGLYPGS